MKSFLLFLAIAATAVPAMAQQAKPVVPRQNPTQRNQMALGEQKMLQMTQKESEISRNLLSNMSAGQRKAFTRAVSSVMGAGKVSEGSVMAKATTLMSPSDRTVWSAYLNRLKPNQLAVLKKMLRNAAAISPGPTRPVPSRLNNL